MIQPSHLIALILLAGSTLFYIRHHKENDMKEDRQRETKSQTGDYILSDKGEKISLMAPEAMINDLWHHFMARYMRIYGNQEELERRQRVFAENYRMIFRHNTQYFNIKDFSGYYLDVNEFADLTHDEFIKRNGFKIQSKTDFELAFNQKVKVLNQVQTQGVTELDWRKKGVVNSIKNQGSCGGCWAFSTCGALESLYNIKNKPKQLIDFSEQQLIDCSTTGGNQGCSGGTMPAAFDYVQNNGITDEKTYPYQTKQNSKCNYDPKTALFQISSYLNVQPNSAAQLKAACNLNPVSIAIDASGITFQFYRGGIFSKDCKQNLDHAVLLVGYAKEKKDKYYIVKNSWGTTWGENGYIRMIDNDPDGKGICGIQMYSSYPQIKSEGQIQAQ